MASLRDLRKRLKATKQQEKITKAMKMVSASKLKRAQEAIVRARPYAIRMNDVLEHIVQTTDLAAHPLLRARVPRRIELLVMTSDRGLCGSFNSNIARAGERFLNANQKTFDQIRISTIGKKGRDHFRRKGYPLHAEYTNIGDRPSIARADEIAADLTGRFRSGEVDAVYLLYNEFKSAISQKVILRQLLPLMPLEGWQENPAVRVGELAAITGDASTLPGREVDIAVPSGDSPAWRPSETLEVTREGFEHVFEPSREVVLDTLLPLHLAVQMWRALLESSAAEHGARMSAMDSAARNARAMIQRLTLHVNRVRQAAITKELMEIVTGAEALKG
jgi:F-type H+-transporting ATPase subunit gamma